MFQQVLVTLVGFFRRSEAGELAHGEKFAAITGSVNAARVGWLTGVVEIRIVIPVFRQIGLRVEAPHRSQRNSGEASVTVLVDVDARGLADRLLGSFLQSGRERFFSPLLLRVGRMTSVEDVSDWIFRYLLLGKRLLSVCHAPPRR